MRYIVDLPIHYSDFINELIKNGKYSDTNGFILASVENQIFLEKIYGRSRGKRE